MHIPLARLVEMNRDEVSSELKLLEDSQIYVLCRRGKDSITATHRLLEMGITAINLDGGLDAWRTNIDPNFPNY
jgi:adenylyltransferase/sulfurtransferase